MVLALSLGMRWTATGTRVVKSWGSFVVPAGKNAAAAASANTGGTCRGRPRGAVGEDEVPARFSREMTLQVASERTDEDCMTQDNNDYHTRFAGVGRLFGHVNKAGLDKSETSSRLQPQCQGDCPNSQPFPAQVMNRLASATVAVVGIGGVGSWTAEALVRSGIGHIILIDLDDICVSNVNRQVHASSSTVGRMKVHEMRSRLLDIHPRCNVTTILDFVSVDNAHDIIGQLLPELTVCVDAIDSHVEKAALIAACCRHGVSVVTCGGAAGRVDPTQVVTGDLARAEYDALLFQCRKALRSDHGFAKGPPNGVRGQGTQYRPRKWNITAVYSLERQATTTTTTTSSGSFSGSSFRSCDGGAFGTACFVTGTYGFVAAGAIVQMIATDTLLLPSRITRSLQPQDSPQHF